MKKKISYAILFSLFLVSCFAYDEIQWKTTKDLYNVPALSSGGHWSQENIKQDTLLRTSNKSGVFYNGYDAGFRDDFYVSAEFENAEVCLPLDSVVNVTCKVQLPEALISGKNKPKYVDEITLQSFFLNEKELIKQTYPNGVTNAEDEYFPWETLLEINGGDLYLSNVYVKLSNSFNFGFSKFFIKDMEMIDEKTYKFECICEDFYHPDSKYKIEKEAIAMLYAEIDGDYIKVFLFDTENLFKIYARINKETEHELNSYFETGLCDLSKVTWPRHADGTCDYEDENGITKKYSHEGIDFAGKRIVSSKTDKKLRTPIHSLINGIVVKTGNQDPNHYGKHIIISDGNNRLFLLGHLYDYADGIQVGSTVTPGQTIAYVGNTGNCAGQREKSSGEGTHLHLTVYITDTAKEITNKDTIKMSDSVDKIISNQDKNDFNYLLHSNSIFKIVNPFNYTESRS